MLRDELGRYLEDFSEERRHGIACELLKEDLACFSAMSTWTAERAADWRELRLPQSLPRMASVSFLGDCLMTELGHSRRLRSASLELGWSAITITSLLLCRRPSI